MNTPWQDIARTTLEGSESGTLSFPASLRMLMDAGFDAYAVDFRRSTRTYYMPDGQSIELATEPTPTPVGEGFEVEILREQIREAVELRPGYTYRGFCARIAQAGCAGYLVSLLGQRVLYYGRTGETHTEFFPGPQPGGRS